MKPVHFLEYLLLVGLWRLYHLVPVRWAYRVGWGLGVGAFALFRRAWGARVGFDIGGIAGRANSRREAYLIARDSLGHFVGHVCEALRASEVVTRENWRDYVEVEMTPATRELLFSPTCPIILATGHLGSWEAGITAIVSARPMLAVARLMDNRYVQRFLERHNFRGGVTVLPKRRGFSGEHMRRWQGTNAALTILFDQWCSSGVPVPFFGHTVLAYTSPARLHVRTGAPVIVGGFLRTGTLRYKMVAVGDPITAVPEGDHETVLRDLTAEMLRRLETVIRMAPEQYLWLHRRWRNTPVPEVPER